MAPADEHKPGSTLKLHSVLLFVSVACLLLACVFAFSAYSIWSQHNVQKRVVIGRDAAVTAIENSLNDQKDLVTQTLARDDIQEKFSDGDANSAIVALRQDLPTAYGVFLVNQDESKIYSDIPSFGYGRLHLIEAAWASNSAQCAFLREGLSIHLGVAAPLQLADKKMAVFVSLPITPVRKAFEHVDFPSAGYLDLRQGDFTIFTRGDTHLQSQTDALAASVDAPGMRITAARPETHPIAVPFPASVNTVLVIVFGIFALLPWLYLRYFRSAQNDDFADSQPIPPPVSLVEEKTDQDQEMAEDSSQAVKTVEPGLFAQCGIYGNTESELTVRMGSLIGQSFGTLMRSLGQTDLVVGYDGRTKGEQLARTFMDGVLRTGCLVRSVGLAPTSVVRFAAQHFQVKNSVSVTGSYRPAHINGFESVLGGKPLIADRLLELHRLIESGKLVRKDPPGKVENVAVQKMYVQKISDDIQISRSLKVIVDAGNGSASEYAVQVLKAIGAEVFPLHCSIDPTFPNRTPDPSDPANLEKLCSAIENNSADIGIAFDGDADRLGVVVPGEGFIRPDRLMMLFATDILLRSPGGVIMYDPFVTHTMASCVLQNGGSPLMWLPYNGTYDEKMREVRAPFAGTMHGQYFFSDRWFGFSDAIYAAARLLEILAQHEDTPADVLSAYPQITNSRVHVVSAREDVQLCMQRILKEAQSGSFGEGNSAVARLWTLDGVRIDFSDGWMMMRSGNDSSIPHALELRLEAESEKALQRIEQVAQSALQHILTPGQILPF